MRSDAICTRLALVVVALAATAAYAQGDSQDGDAKPLLQRENLFVMGHRGMGEEAPEGTLESFREAWKLGLAPEADIRTTKDGAIVSFHDDNFQRILPTASASVKAQGVKDLTLEELRKLDVGAYKGERFKGQRPVAVAEIVAALKEDPKRLVVCDLKNVELPQFARETQEVWPQIYLTSSDRRALKEWKKLAPTSKTRLWTPRAWVDKPDDRRAGFQAVLEDEFDAIDVYEIHAKLDRNGLVAPTADEVKRMAQETSKRGVLLEIMPLTFGDHEFPYVMLLEAGADALSTDYPTPTVSAIERYFETRR